MSKTATLIHTRLAAHLEPHGAVSEFARKTGIPRRNIDNWLSGTAIPLEAVDAIAKGMDTTPWQLLQPVGAKPSPDPALARLALIGEIASRLATADDTQLDDILAVLSGPGAEAAGRRGELPDDEIDEADVGSRPSRRTK